MNVHVANAEKHLAFSFIQGRTKQWYWKAKSNRN
nr:MAG TPA: hypothetical protein [Caudoviricetes sp.]